MIPNLSFACEFENEAIEVPREAGASAQRVPRQSPGTSVAARSKAEPAEPRNERKGGKALLILDIWLNRGAIFGSRCKACSKEYYECR